MRKFRFLWVLMVLALAALACNAPASTAPTRPPTPVPLTTQEIQQFEQEVAATLANPAPSGEVTVTITDAQINAYVTGQYSAALKDVISEPQIHFADGQVEVYGKVTQGPITADATIILKPLVAEGGKPKLKVESINIGPLPVPDSLVQQLNQNIDSILEDYLANIGETFVVNSITITPGQMSINGVKQ